MIHPHVTYEYVLHRRLEWSVLASKLVTGRVVQQGERIINLRSYPLLYRREDEPLKFDELTGERGKEVFEALCQELNRFYYLYSLLETASYVRNQNHKILIVKYQAIGYIL